MKAHIADTNNGEMVLDNPLAALRIPMFFSRSFLTEYFKTIQFSQILLQAKQKPKRIPEIDYIEMKTDFSFAEVPQADANIDNVKPILL
jgi:hypothetical protein